MRTMDAVMQHKEAAYYERIDNKIRCLLCPHHCMIHEGGHGICGVRSHKAGKLIATTYGRLSAIHFDPVEKKPLYHFYPGTIILSIGSVGCNMHCQCCQNWQISQAGPENFSFSDRYRADQLVTLAKSRERNIGIAYTYNEPSINFEYVLDVAREFRKNGMKNVMVSNGFIESGPLDELLTCMDAFNIDLKAFSDNFYRTITGARLEPVLKTLIRIALSGAHLEITNLVIPAKNDNPEEFTAMVKWIADNLGNDTILHLSRYHPMFRMNIESTPLSTLLKLAETAARYLSFVYIGNIETADFQNTRCPACHTTVIKRYGYHTEIGSLDENGNCSKCHRHILSR